MRIFGAFAAVAVALGAPVAIGRAPAAGGGPTGNQASIAYYTKATDNLLDKPADAQVERGASFYGYQSSTSWYVSWNVPHAQYPFQRPAAEAGLYVLAHHKIAWGTTTWTARGLPALQFFFVPGASYWAFLGPHHTAACWNRATGSTAWINTDFNNTGKQPWYVGNSPYTTPPHYDPMVRDGNVVRITSTYSYRHGARVSETDTIDRATTEFTAATLHVAAAKSSAAYHAGVRVSVFAKAPAEPRIVLCG